MRSSFVSNLQFQILSASLFSLKFKILVWRLFSKCCAS